MVLVENCFSKSIGENSEAEGNTVDFPSVPGSQESDFQNSLVVYRGFADEKPTQLCGDYFVHHEIRIPMKQPVLYI